VIADLVGDNVGDCAGRGADLFESISGEIIAAMILGGKMAAGAGLGTEATTRYILFPIAVQGVSLVACALGTLVAIKGASPALSPLSLMRRGLLTSFFFLAFAFAFICWWLLDSDKAPEAWWRFLFCGYYGMLAGFLSSLFTEYYTDDEYPPVQSIVEAAKSGHATAIISGIALGMESTALPTLSASLALLCAYWTGQSSGFPSNAVSNHGGGLFGIAVATMGMLSVAGYVLAMDFFGPIADNAGGIIEMSDSEDRLEGARNVSDRLDAAGNTTKAVTKGYAMSSAYLACFLLFSAFMAEVATHSSPNSLTE